MDGDAKATAFPQADVLGADRNGNIIKTIVSDGLKVENGNLKVKAGTNVNIGNDGAVNVATAGDATDPAGVIRSVKNAKFVGTDANGQLVAKTITVPTVPTAGFLLEDVNGVRKVKNKIESELGSIVNGATVPLGLYKNGTTVQLALDLSSPTDEPSFNTGNVTGSGYTEIVPYWGYTGLGGDEYVTYPTTAGGTVTKGNMTVTKTTNTSGDNVYQYDIAIPRFVEGIRLLTVDFCCAGDSEASADMRIWLINGSAAVNIAKVHSFSYGYKSSGEQINTNRYSSYQGILPIKSGVDIRFVSSGKLRHAHILLFNR